MKFLKRGIFLTIEGIDGSGKTTQALLLKDYLKKHKSRQVILTREPGGTKAGEMIRKILLKKSGVDITPLTELLLYEADRTQHLKEVITPALKEGKIVISDRFFDATLAYQGFGRGVDLKLIKKIDELICRKLIPDLTLFLDLPAENGIKRIRERLKRASKKKKKETRFDEEPIGFHKRIRNGYRFLAKCEPHRIKIIDAREPRKEVFKKIVAHVNNLIFKEK